MKLIFMSGPAGVGKSTHIKQHLSDATIVSGDAIGIELGLEHEPNNGQVINTIIERVKQHMKDQEDTIVIDATMLNRTRRASILDQVRPDKTGYEVEVVMLHKPLAEIKRQNNQRTGSERVPDEHIENMYFAMQPPKVGLDCDRFTIIAPPLSAYMDEINATIDESHHSSYHQETLREHTQMTIDKSIEIYGEDSELVEIAKYHDLGKSVTRKSLTDAPHLVRSYAEYAFGGLDMFKYHANVSAMYYHIDKGENANTDISDAILHHMNAHQSPDITKNRAVKRENVTEHAIELMEQFRDIDSSSKVVDDVKSETFAKVQELCRQARELQRDPSITVPDIVQLIAHEDIKTSANWEDSLLTFKYLHAGVDFTNPLIRNARGLTMTLDGEIVTIGFEKFFNYMQLEEERSWMPYDKAFKDEYTGLEPKDKHRVWEKMDGTFLSLSVLNDEFIVATSSATNTEYSDRAKTYFEQLPTSDALKQYIKDNNVSLFFEYTSPEHPMIIQYDEEKYTFIGERTKDIYNPEIRRPDMSRFGLENVASKWMTLDELIEYQQTDKTSEGVVVENQYGRLLKFKTDYWFESKADYANLFFGEPYTRRKMETLLCSIQDDTIDDLLAHDNQREMNFHPVVEFKSLYDQYEQKYKQAIRDCRDMTRAEVAAMGGDKDIKSMVLAERDGMTLKYKLQKSTFRRPFRERLQEQLKEQHRNAINAHDLIDDIDEQTERTL